MARKGTMKWNLRAVARIALLPYVCMGLEEAIVPAKRCILL